MTEPVITAIYDMPYAPDDYFYYEKSVRKLYRSGAQRAAEKFGQTEAALDVGHAYGQNIVTGFNETPTLDLAPVYIRLAGIEGAFLLDAATYAWGPEGMVVSSDLMLLGVTGYDGLVPPATSWLRLPAAPSAIGPAGATTIEASPVKANSINIPSGFDARNPAAVLASLPTNGVDVFREWRANTVVLPPALVLEQFIVAAGPYLAMREFEYGLILEPETAAIAAGPVAEFTWVTQVVPPAAALTLAGLAPAISTGVRVVVPSADAGLSALVPVVAGGASVVVPTAGVAVAGVVPELVGRQRTQVLVPVAGVSVAGLAPTMATGALVAVPAAWATVAGVAPAVGRKAYRYYMLSEFADTALNSDAIDFGEIEVYNINTKHTGITCTTNFAFSFGSALALVDGVTGSATRAFRVGWASVRPTATIKLDLGSTKMVTHIKIFSLFAQPRFPASFAFSGSDDNITFTPIATVTVGTSFASLGDNSYSSSKVAV